MRYLLLSPAPNRKAMATLITLNTTSKVPIMFKPVLDRLVSARQASTLAAKALVCTTNA